MRILTWWHCNARGTMLVRTGLRLGWVGLGRGLHKIEVKLVLVLLILPVMTSLSSGEPASGNDWVREDKGDEDEDDFEAGYYITSLSSISSSMRRRSRVVTGIVLQMNWLASNEPNQTQERSIQSGLIVINVWCLLYNLTHFNLLSESNNKSDVFFGLCACLLSSPRLCPVGTGQ